MFGQSHALGWSVRAFRACLFLDESALNLITTNISTNRLNSHLPSREGNAWNSAPGRSLLYRARAAACTTVRVKGRRAQSFRSALAPAGMVLDLLDRKKEKKRQTLSSEVFPGKTQGFKHTQLAQGHSGGVPHPESGLANKRNYPASLVL